ncbi:MAG TPA: hypothetical protein VEV43_13215, partial [Actinomycetota bacterium]|nr:hypothetical protein [Actinomycetota bacterium]
VPGTEVLGGTTVAQGQTSTTEGTTTGSAGTGSTTSNDAKAKTKGGSTAGSAATGGSGSEPETVVLGETLTRPEGSSETRAAGRSDSAEGTELLGWVVPLEGAAFGATALFLVAVVGLFFFLLIKRRKRTNYVHSTEFGLARQLGYWTIRTFEGRIFGQI